MAEIDQLGDLREDLDLFLVKKPPRL